MQSLIHKEAEARARVAALRYNHGGTYAAASRATGISPVQLSGWHRGKHLPQAANMDWLREITS